MKKLLPFILFVACGGQPYMQPTASDDHIKSGAVCQGSKDWNRRNVCGEGNESGLCVKVVDGPLILTELRTSDNCPHEIMIGIKDTYSGEDVSQAPRWKMNSKPLESLVLQHSAVTIKEGESLFVGTDGYNSKIDGSCCYVSWVGYDPKDRFE